MRFFAPARTNVFFERIPDFEPAEILFSSGFVKYSHAPGAHFHRPHSKG